MKDKCIGYVRVSTLKQIEGHSLSYQKEAIQKFSEMNNIDLVKIYADEGISGAKFRPELEKAIKRVINDDKINGIIFYSIFRFGRSTEDIKEKLMLIKQAGKKFFSTKENIDLDSSQGRFMFNVLSDVAEFERELIIERMQTGKEYAKLHGTKSGKAFGRPKADIDWDKVRELRKAGLSWTKTAKYLGVSTPTLINRASQEGIS